MRKRKGEAAHGDPNQPAPREEDLRKTRLAAALRENLRKRKAQTQARRPPPEADDSGA